MNELDKEMRRLENLFASRVDKVNESLKAAYAHAIEAGKCMARIAEHPQANELPPRVMRRRRRR